MGEIAVIAGVAAELALHIGSGSVLTEVRGIQDTRSAQLLADAETLKGQNLKLELQVAEAKKLAGPRNIRGDDQAHLKLALEPFKGTAYDLSTPPITTHAPYAGLLELEPGSFLVNSLIWTLSKLAGWKLQSVTGEIAKLSLPAPTLAMVAEPTPAGPFSLPPIFLGQISGVVGVRIPLPKDSAERFKAAVALAHALNEVGIWTEFDPLEPYNDIPTGALTGDAVHIVIGTKP